MTERSEVERRYRALLRAYPRAYRAGRGDEMVATHLEIAARRHPGRRWPSAADVGDIVAGGLRQRLRAWGAGGLLDAAPVAAAVALGAAVMLAALWLAQIETEAAPEGLPWRPAGPFLTLGGYVWITWLLAGASAVLLPGRVTRALVAVALVSTVAVIPASAVLPFAKPPVVVLLAVFVLGAAALGWGSRPSRWARAGVLGGSATGVLVHAGHRRDTYWGIDTYLLLSVAAGILLVALVVAVVLTARADTRGWWALVILLTPATSLTVWPATEEFYGRPSWLSLATVAVGLALLSLAVVPAVGFLRLRASTAPDPRRMADRLLR